MLFVWQFYLLIVEGLLETLRLYSSLKGKVLSPLQVVTFAGVKSSPAVALHGYDLATATPLC